MTISSAKASSKPFLTHLAGLRGFAILCVILFHLNGDFFHEGYLGVDVFLVISGYLLTAEWLKYGCSPFWDFIKRKVVRIIPPLAALVLPVLIASAYIVNTEDGLYSAGKTALMALLGGANWYLENTTTDYFAAAANLNPFLHTWYLSVTLQVYVLWIMCCTCFRRLQRRWMIVFLALAGVVSFLYTHSYQLQNVVSSLSLPTWRQIDDVSYFQTSGRLWEVLAGGIVFILPSATSERGRYAGSCIGGALLLTALLFGAETGGRVAVLLTVGGTILLLKYVPGTYLNSILGNGLFQCLGKVSFSWYLVHFPLFVLFKITYGGTLSPGISLSLFLISLALAWLMWCGFEKHRFSLWKTLSIWGVAGVVAYTVGYTPVLVRTAFGSEEPQYPVYERKDLSVNPHLMEGFSHDDILPSRGIIACMCNKYLSCPDLLPLGRTDAESCFVVIGDSNAQHLYAGLNELASDLQISGVQVPSIILPLWNRYIKLNGDNYLYNKEKGEALMKWLAGHPELKTVFIGQLWDNRMRSASLDWEMNTVEASYQSNEQALREFCKKLQEMNRQVVLISPTPCMPYDRKRFENGLAYLRWRSKQPQAHREEDCFILTPEKYFKANEAVFEIFNRLETEGVCKILRIEKGMFPDGTFRMCRGKTLYMRDNTHITPPAAIELLQAVKQDFMELLK